MSREQDKPDAGEQLILLALPPGFLDDLPGEDQRAITAMVGMPVMLIGYDEDGRAELHFDDPFDPRTDQSSTRTPSGSGLSSFAELAAKPKL